jgi:hypothetical protein
MTPKNEAKIMCWVAEKVATKEIAAHLGVHPSTIRHLAVLRELLPNASPPPTKARSGRPGITTYKLEARLRDYVLRNPFKTSRAVKCSVANWQKFRPHNRKVAPKNSQRPDKLAAEFSTKLGKSG